MPNLSTLPLASLTLNEAARPSAPPVPEATDQHRSQGKHLALIHRHYLQEMARIAAVLARIEAGDAPPEHLKRIVLSLDMSQNLRAFGSLCGEGCRILKMHHDIEASDMFPRIEAAGNGAFAAIVAKLRAEHEVVHELLTRLDRAADTLIAEPTDANLAQAAATFRQLETVIRSHFGYEESELAEAIGYYLGHI